MSEVVNGETSLAQRWCALQLLHDRIASDVEKVLQPRHGISVREFSLLEVLERQHDGEGGHLKMQELARSVALSQSATTRLVSRLEERGLLTRYICPTDRRGIYTEVTDKGRALLERARPSNQESLNHALDALADEEEFASLVQALRS